MYNSIVVGYDESLSSLAALKEASRWVKAHGGKLTLRSELGKGTEVEVVLPLEPVPVRP